MSELPTYSFLPWLRNGAANTIQSDDQDNSVLLRARINVDLKVDARKTDDTTLVETIHKDIDLYGPGDIVGIDSRSIVKTDPLNWITNYEPNYLPYIEFYDEDFPWRYTPARANGERLRPWITLVVLKAEEFEDRSKGDDQPLPSIKLKGASAGDVFPDPAQLWAWAHIHVNKDLTPGAEVSNLTVVNNLTGLLSQNADMAYSRIISPRKLEEKAAYNAFLIPSFESGRLAGLGADIPAATVATASSWGNNQEEFPYYHRWYFRTGGMGDFEYLVNLLKPQPTDKMVGVRDMDLLHPGSNLPAITMPEEIKGVLKLGGALKVPFDTLHELDKLEVTRFDQWDEDPYPHDFEKRMAKLVNLADDYVSKSSLQANTDADVQTEAGKYDPDPIITMPLYARWHALVNRLLEKENGDEISNNTNWIHELNLDPRFRVPAGIGTQVIQQNQEEYMHAAWEQVGDIIEANRKIRLAQMAKEASWFYYKKYFEALPFSQMLNLAAPVRRRVISDGLTLHYQLERSKVPPVIVSTVFRKVSSPGYPVAKRIVKANVNNAGIAPVNVSKHFKKTNWIEQINAGDLVITVPKTFPTEGLLLQKAAEGLIPEGRPGELGKLSVKYPWLKWISLVVGIILALMAVVGGAYLLLIAAALFFAGWYFLIKAEKNMQASLGLDEDKQTPGSIEKMPARPDFKITKPAASFNPVAGTTDSAESVKFKSALKDAYTLISIKYPVVEKPILDIKRISADILKQIHPDTSVAKRLAEFIQVPLRIKDAQVDEDFGEVMAYPEYDLPMYLPLSKLSTELFLPNIKLIPENSISLLETNQKFIEAYMTGINHEMSRELLWREYPTDQRGSYFRQFWDVSSFYPGNPAPDNLREKLRDIPPIHTWSLSTELGTHNQRETGGDSAQLVLVIRGELLKRYPTAVIYAQKAQWDQTQGENDPDKERILAELDIAEQDNPPTTKVKTPLFQAKVEPDIYFFGFDLTSLEVKGGTKGTEDPGWFFVIKERPGEPRFGLDQPVTDETPRLINWNNLSWKHINTPEGSCIDLNQTLSFTGYDSGVDQENKPNAQDVQAKWSPATNSAQLAYILFQVPVMVAVHGSRMLP